MTVGTGERGKHTQRRVDTGVGGEAGRGGGGGRFLVFHFLSSYITLCSTRHQINNGPTYPILSWTSSCCARPPRGVYRPSSSSPPSPLLPSFPRVYVTRLLFSSPSPSPPPSHRIEAYLPENFFPICRQRRENDSNRYMYLRIPMMTNPLFLLPLPFPLFLERRNEGYGDEGDPFPLLS